MSETTKAVFLSYASQDAEAARRIAESLRAAGVEVWFDQNELVGGDAWDAKIRGQIKECALFVPIISANTQERLEGYFRLEWRLADQRTHLMAKGRAFLLPVVVDGTPDADAQVPDSFAEVQWTKLPDGVSSSAFAERVRKLSHKEPEPGSRPPVAPTVSLPDHSPAQPAPGINSQSVAVLAFANLSNDKDNEYFSDGISEELLNVLAKVPELKVTARTSAFHFKGKDTPIPEIARQLGVAYVVEGSVRKMGNRVRITAQLIKAADGFHVWSENFDRELQDIFAVQDEIAGLIARNLQVKLGVAGREARVVNPEAHRLVLEGRHFWAMRTEKAFARAEQAYGRALEIDPDFAQAHAGMADVSAVRSWYASLGGGVPFKGELARASTEARRAFELDPSLAEVQASLGTVAYQEFRWADSEEHFRQAFQLAPNFALAHHWHAHLLASRGRVDLGLAALERSIALDPLSFVTLVIYACQLNWAQRYEDVLAITDRARPLRSTMHAPLEGARAMALLGLGRNEEAAAAARLTLREKSFAQRWWSGEETLYVLNRAGRVGESAEILRQWQAGLPPDNLAHGPLLHAMGRFEEALPFLKQTSPTFFARFHFQTLWDDVRDDPHFIQLIEQLGCAAEYRTGRATLALMLRDRETQQ